MFRPTQALAYLGRIASAYLAIIGFVAFLSFAAVYLSRQPGIPLRAESLLLDLGLPALLGAIPGLAALWIAWRTAGRFVHTLYGLESIEQGQGFLSTRFFGHPSAGPYLIVKEGKVASGNDAVKKIGGPGSLVIYNDSAVVLERAGQLTRVKRGPGILPLEPFEKAWDIIDLRPQRWDFPVSAITYDGIPITYHADVSFQVGDTDSDIFKAATCKWVRDAWRTEPDRLMTWTKRVVIGDMEGSLRAILALHTLDDLLDPGCRREVREELERRLTNAAPGLGVKILRVALGDIKLRDRVLQQWTKTWQTERTREIEKALAEGRAMSDRIAMQARAEVRTSMLAYTARMFASVTERGDKLSKGFVVLSFVDMIKRTASSRQLYLPDDIMKTLDMLEKRFKKLDLRGPRE